jgi:hypothetical protein
MTAERAIANIAPAGVRMPAPCRLGRGKTVRRARCIMSTTIQPNSHKKNKMRKRDIFICSGSIITRGFRDIIPLCLKKGGSFPVWPQKVAYFGLSFLWGFFRYE